MLKTPDERKFLTFAFLSLFFFTLLIIWKHEFLPQMDLPEHIAQVSLLRHINDPAISDGYHFNWLTPYMTGILLAGAISFVFGVLPAVKIMTTLSILGLVFSLYYLLKKTNGDPWWALLGFPLGFGYNYVLGHFNFMVAMPLSVLLLALSVDLSERFTHRRLLIWGFFSFILFFSHGLLYSATIALTAPFLLVPNHHGGHRQLRLVFTSTLALPVAWWIFLHSSEANFQQASSFNLNPMKFLFIPQNLLSEKNDPLATGLGLLMILCFFFTGRPSIRKKRWAPLAIFLLIYLFVPGIISDAAHFAYHRLAFLIVPALILGLSHSYRPPFWTRISRIFLFALASLWLGISYVRASNFNREAQDFQTLLSQIPEKSKVLALLFKQNSQYTDGRPYRYFSGYLSAYRKTDLNFSFSMQPPQLIRNDKLAGKSYSNRRHLHWFPSSYKPEDSQGYDFCLISADRDMQLSPMTLIAHEGQWWLYKINRPPSPLPSSPS